jgi:hypothetical protein
MDSEIILALVNLFNSAVMGFVIVYIIWSLKELKRQKPPEEEISEEEIEKVLD